MAVMRVVWYVKRDRIPSARCAVREGYQREDGRSILKKEDMCQSCGLKRWRSATTLC